MQNLINYLNNGKTTNDLVQELGIEAVYHDTLPLVILNYGIHSPKPDPVARECRATVLDTRTNAVVARSFPRFFNWGEMADEMPLFDFGNFYTTEKLDGSLCVIYNFEGKWMANTRGSFGQGKIEFADKTWHQGFCEAMGILDLSDLTLDPSLTYVCEFTSPWNKVVRTYVKPEMHLLTCFGPDGELPREVVSSLPCNYGVFRKPMQFAFKSIAGIREYLDGLAATDPTFEGVVICDKDFHRWKIKSPTYLSLHQLRGNNNVFNPKHLLPFVLRNEGDELLTYFPECKPVYEEVFKKVQAAWWHLRCLWVDNWQIQDQKEFALAIVGKTPFTGILFQLRKEDGKDQTEKLLEAAWRASAAQIEKHLL